MKLNKISTILALGVILFIQTSCKKFLDVNQDPAQVTKAPVTNLLTQATAETAFDAGSDLQRYTALIIQQYAGMTSGTPSQTQLYETYLISGSDLNNLYLNYYGSSLNNLQIIINETTKNNQPNARGIAKLIKCYNYQLLVDIFGDIPYFEASKFFANTAPSLTPAVDIYKDLITEIDKAITDLNDTSTQTDFGTYSTIYTGSFSTTKTKWIKFANTLKLRILLHHLKADAAYATPLLNTLLAQPASQFFESNADNFEMPFFSVANQTNPINQFNEKRAQNLIANKTLVDLMNANNDPRRAVYFTDYPLGSGTFVGGRTQPNAQSLAASTNYSFLGSYLMGSLTKAGKDGSKNVYSGDAPIRMLTYAEYNFIRAELATMGIGTDAAGYFNKGVTASLDAAGVSSADKTAYLSTRGTLTSTVADQLKQIIEEKYIANFGVAVEPWTDWRRTGFPVLYDIQSTYNNNKIPRSLFYPQSAVDLNPTNFKQKADMNVKIFWDK